MSMRAYVDGIFARLDAFNQTDLRGVKLLTDDDKELGAEIDKALSELGMLILIGLPEMTNREPNKAGSSPANFEIRSEIVVGEDPLMWRDEPDDDTALDIAEFVVSKLQGLEISGFGALRVASAVHIPDAKRQLYQIEITSNRIVDVTS